MDRRWSWAAETVDPYAMSQEKRSFTEKGGSQPIGMHVTLFQETLTFIRRYPRH